VKSWRVTAGVYEGDRPPVELEGLPEAGAALADQAGRREVAEVRVLPGPDLGFVANAAELVLGVGAALVIDADVAGAVVGLEQFYQGDKVRTAVLHPQAKVHAGIGLQHDGHGLCSGRVRVLQLSIALGAGRPCRHSWAILRPLAALPTLTIPNIPPATSSAPRGGTKSVKIGILRFGSGRRLGAPVLQCFSKLLIFGPGGHRQAGDFGNIEKFSIESSIAQGRGIPPYQEEIRKARIPRHPVLRFVAVCLTGIGVPRGRPTVKPCSLQPADSTPFTTRRKRRHRSKSVNFDLGVLPAPAFPLHFAGEAPILAWPLAATK